MRRFFDPARWRPVLFDQRGAGRSTPHASLEANTTAHLIEDIERLRAHLGVDKWTVFGGSWGATLALAYAQTHPHRVDGLILRGVFLCTRSEIDWFFRGGARVMLPEAWEDFVAPLPKARRDDPVAAYYDILTHLDRNARRSYARAWAGWESTALSHRRTVVGPSPVNPAAADALARIECHYMINEGFFETPDQLIDNMGVLSEHPGYIVQGRLDMVTPPAAAWRLAKAWPEAHLNIVEDCGHAASEPGLVDGLVRATDDLASRLGR
jgi:proline iminopeptidase